MRPMCSLLIYFALVFPGGALAAPRLYWLAQRAAGHWHSMSGLAGQPFYRFLDRSMLGMALICMWPLIRCGGVRSWRDLGFVPQGRPAVQILRGFALGWASLAAAALLALCFGAFIVRHSSAEVVQHLINATWAAVVVAILEELVFRGALFGLLRRCMPWPAALVVSSAIYAGVHFIQKGPAEIHVQWDSGLALLWQMLCHPPPLIPAFLTLFVAGLILGLSYQRTGALYFSIGVHAGWIFWLKAYGFLLGPSGVAPFFLGTGKLIDGWLACLLLVIVFILIVRQRHASSPSGGMCQ